MWVPEDTKWRFEWEGRNHGRLSTNYLNQRKEIRPVVLRAKHIDDLND